MKVPLWGWIVWALLGFGLELLALTDASPNDTLTATIVKLVPAWLVFMLIGWLGWHFAQAYRSRQQR